MWATQKSEWPGVTPFSVVSPRLTWSGSQWNVHQKVQILLTEIMSEGRQINPLILFLTLSKFPFYLCHSGVEQCLDANCSNKIKCEVFVFSQQHVADLVSILGWCQSVVVRSWLTAIFENLVGFITTRPLVCYFALKMEAAKFSEMSANQPVTAQEWKDVRWLFICAECLYL
jgi:hypothetical protein